MRRRQRRLRSWLRHERMTVAMTLAEMTHHTAQGDRSWPGSGRRWCTTRTTHHGDRRHHLRGCGRAVSLSPGRRGATAACGAPQGKLLSRVCHRWRTLQLKPSMVAPSVTSFKANLARKKFEEEEKKYQERAAETRRRAQALLDHASSLPKRKRKKKRKKRLPKSSARHPLPSGIRTRKSGHFSTSPSFWQSRVLCPGVAWFNSGYSRVSSQRLWISSLFSTCWTRILRSFLIFCILLLTPGIWQPLVRCLPCPGYTENLDFLREDFSHYFLRALVFGSHFAVFGVAFGV